MKLRYYLCKKGESKKGERNILILCSNVKYVFHQIIYKIPYIDVCNIYSDFRFLDNYIYLRTIEDMYMVRGIAFDLILVTVDLVDKIDPKIMYEIKLQLTPEGEVFFYEP